VCARVAAQAAARPEHGDGQQHGGGEQQRTADDEAGGGGHGVQGRPTPLQASRLRGYPGRVARELLLA